MSITVEFLGSGDAFASGGRFHSSTLLRTPAGLALVDCGPTAPVALQRRGIRPGEIGVVLLTHLHGDHFGGLPFFLLDKAFSEGRDTPLTIAGPAGTEETIARGIDVLFPATLERVREATRIRFVELQPGRLAHVREFDVSAYQVPHSAGVVSQALRLSVSGLVLAFSSDTEWDPSLVEVSRDADLFVCECTAYREPLAGHLSLERLLAHAGELRARRIVLNHLGRDMQQHLGEAPWECAHDGLAIVVAKGEAQPGA